MWLGWCRITFICWNETPLRLEGLPERGSRGDRFGPGNDRLVSDARVLGPGRHESPSHQGKLPNGLTGVLANGQDGLTWRDVVAGTPLVFLGDGTEIFLDKLLSPR